LSLHDVLDRVLILNEGDDPHLCFTLGTLKRIHLVDSLYAGGPTTLTKLDSTDFGELTEVTTIVALLFLGWRSDFSAFTPSPTRVPTVVSCNALIGLRNMTRELSKELQCVKLMSSTVFSGIGNDVVLY
jgi:hypothetical protein